MSFTTGKVENSVPCSENISIDENMLAMDALSELAKQFTEHTDNEKLLNNLLLALSGQFSVNNVFIYGKFKS